MVRSLSFLLTLLIIACYSSLVVCASQEQKWIDKKVKKPLDFRAFPILSKALKSNENLTEIIFSRDINDQTYKYYVYGILPNGTQTFLPHITFINSTTSLAFVDPTPFGQRGAYLQKDGFTLTPIIVDTKNMIFTDFKVQAFNSKIHSDTTEQSWLSASFKRQESSITPQEGEITDLEAKVIPFILGQVANKNITISWKISKSVENVQGYFILIGPNKNATQVKSFFFSDPYTTNVTISFGFFTGKYDISVVVYNKQGALTSPTAVNQVSIYESQPI